MPATKDPTDDWRHSDSKHALTFAPGSKKFIASLFIKDSSRNHTLLPGIDVPAASRGTESGGGVNDVAHESEELGVAEQNVSVSFTKQRAAIKAEIEDKSRSCTERHMLRVCNRKLAPVHSYPIVLCSD